jgi:hypothetical protein
VFDLRNFSLREMTELGSRLRRIGAGAECLEEVAQRVVRLLFEELVDSESGKRACALIRFFKTHEYGQLDDALQRFARERFAQPENPCDQMKCLTLLATAGEQEAWNFRERSQDHQAIPLASAEIVSRAPMISRLLSDLGVTVEALLGGAPELLVEPDPSSFNVFYVADARGRSCIPAQTGFVDVVGVRSVLGFGGMFPSGNIFAVIMFSKVPISRETANLFRTLALNVKMAALPYDRSVFGGRELAVANA